MWKIKAITLIKNTFKSNCPVCGSKKKVVIRRLQTHLVEVRCQCSVATAHFSETTYYTD